MAVPLQAEEPTAATGGQLLLLRNGQALEGRISRSDDVYHVILCDGEIRIKAADVEFVCKNLEEGYQRKRAAIASGSLREHLDLAQWCEKNKLLDHAAAELADAAAIAPGNPMVRFLQRRLRTAMEPLPDRPKTAVVADQSPSNEELDRMIRSLPHKAVENFTQSVQPLLMNNCTTSGCHGPQSKAGLHLERAFAGQPTGRRLTQRNIYAVMQYVNRDDPLSSRILTVPASPHGNAKTAIFGGPQVAQYKRLLDWVMLFAPADLPAMPEQNLDPQSGLAEDGFELEPGATTNSRHAPSDWLTPGFPAGENGKPRLLPAAARKGRLLTPMAKDGAKQAVFQEPASGVPTLERGNEKAKILAQARENEKKIKRDQPGAQFIPRDAFDPEIFNRRYFKATDLDDSRSEIKRSSQQ